MMAGRSRLRFWLYVSLAAPGLAVSGCSGITDAVPRQAVTGTVTLDGRPMASGTIVFTPAGAHSALVPISAFDTIKNGRFSISRGKGLVPAKYLIAIYSGKKVKVPHGPEMSDEEAQAQAKDLIPAKYNTSTELEVEIKRAGIKELKIDIDSK